MPNIFIIIAVFTLVIAAIFLVSFFAQSLFGLAKIWKYIFFIFFLAVFIAFFLTSRATSMIADYVYPVVSVLIGAFFLSSLIIVPAFLVQLLSQYVLNFDISKILAYTSLVAMVGINILWLYNGFVTTERRVTIHTEKNTSLKGKNIILISDTHYGKIFGINSTKKLVQQINSLDNIAFVVLPWDLFDGPKIDFNAIMQELDKINKPVFFSLGNHEEYGDMNAMLEAVKKTHFTILDGESVKYNDIIISGLDYYDNHSKENFAKNLAQIAPTNETFNILLRHEPTFVDVAHANNYDLIVSGHTHKWQMWPFSYITKNIYGKYFYGLSEDNGKYSVTSSGYGSWGPPQRLGSQSEIVIISIQ